MNTVVIKQVNHHGADTKVFRACALPSVRNSNYYPSLGVIANCTADPASIGALHCASKAFIKFVEPKADRDELETRIALKELSPGSRIWEAELSPKVGSK